MAQITVGVDVGKASHRAAAYDPAADRVLGQLSFDVDRAGFARFEAFLERLAAASDAVRARRPGGERALPPTLLGFLAERGHRVVLVNPWQAAHFRRSQGKKAKTDRMEARTLARFVAVRGLEPAPPPPTALEGLRELTRFRAELVVDRTATLNRLHAAVDLAFPELLGGAGRARQPHGPGGPVSLAHRRRRGRRLAHRRRPTVHPAGEPAEGLAADQSLLGAQ